MYIRCQAMLQNALQPANWLRFDYELHSEECEWTFHESITKSMAKDFIVDATKNLKDFSLRSVRDDEIVLDYFTPTAKWMDQIRIELISRGDKQPLLAVVVAKSTGIVPLMVPLAPLLSILFIWVPLKDHGKTGEEIYQFQKEIEAISKTTVTSRTTRYSLSNPRGKGKGPSPASLEAPPPITTLEVECE